MENICNFNNSCKVLKEVYLDNRINPETTDSESPEKPFDRAVYHYERGCEYLKKDILDMAIEEFTMAIRLYPENAEYYCMRGIAFSSSNDQDNAESDFTMAIRLVQNRF
jgi:lipoprotein NlpI